MKVVALRVALCATAAVLAGCSSFQFETKKIDYKSASSNKVPPLEIPPDLTSPTRDNRYVIPETGRGAMTFSQYAGERSTAQPSEVLPTVEKIRIERSGNQRWLVVAETPANLWEQVKDFWRETGFVINVERPEAGVMETDWAENRAKIGQDFIRNMLGKVLDSLYSTPERDKFRTRLEPGAEPGTTEIFISHRGMYEIFTTESRDTTRWQPRPADPDLEAEMLRRLMVRLGSDQKRAETQLAAAKTNIPERVRLVEDGGAGSLAKFVYRQLPETRITVVEIDPQIEIIARLHFKLPDDPGRLRIVIGDGADYMRQPGRAFDAIFVDGFDKHGRAGVLDTLPFYQACRARLTANGLLSVNLLGRSRGFAASTQRIAEAFDGRALVFPSCDSGNAIAFGAGEEAVNVHLTDMSARAKVLKAGAGIDLFPLLPRLQAAGKLVQERLRIG